MPTSSHPQSRQGGQVHYTPAAAEASDDREQILAFVLPLIDFY